MAPRTIAEGVSQDYLTPVPVRLAAAWTSFMFLYVYADILGLYLPGTVENILAGMVWELRITQTWAVGALALMAIPILMVVLSVLLSPRASRVANLVGAALYVLVSIGNAVGESWTYYYGLAAVLEVAVLAIILRTAWTWRRASGASGAPAPRAPSTAVEMG